jgi:hypothetical protein
MAITGWGWNNKSKQQLFEKEPLLRALEPMARALQTKNFGSDLLETVWRFVAGGVWLTVKEYLHSP